MKRKITRISNNKDVDLTKLDEKQLIKLHYEEEKYVASKLKELPPFSEERTALLKKSYEIIDIIKYYRNKFKNMKIYDKHEECQIFSLLREKMGNKKLNVLEIGCGRGTLINRLSESSYLKLYCCDLFLPQLKRNIHFINDTAYNALKTFKDNSIDIIIADNVCEHFLPDEVDEIYELMHKKLSIDGKILFFIPNSYLGPSDISKFFLKVGEKPQGFHFMEQSYRENLKLFNRHRLYTDYLVILNKGIYRLYKNFLAIDKIKIFCEPLFGRIKDIHLRKKFFDHLGYKIYILKK